MWLTARMCLRCILLSQWTTYFTAIATRGITLTQPQESAPTGTQTWTWWVLLLRRNRPSFPAWIFGWITRLCAMRTHLWSVWSMQRLYYCFHERKTKLKSYILKESLTQWHWTYGISTAMRCSDADPGLLEPSPSRRSDFLTLPHAASRIWWKGLLDLASTS